MATPILNSDYICTDDVGNIVSTIQFTNANTYIVTYGTIRYNAHYGNWAFSEFGPTWDLDIQRVILFEPGDMPKN